VTDDSVVGAPLATRVEPGAPAPRQVPPGRLLGWAILVGALAAISYAGNIAGGKPPDDVLYLWSTAIGGAVQYALILALVLLIARGVPREALGLRRPPSWGAAAGWIVGALVAIWVVGAILNVFLKAGEEQGLVPNGWDSSRAAPFVANFVVVALVAPVVEELTYRGLGYAAVRDVLGDVGAVLVTAVVFGLAHGLVVALPVLTIFGAILAIVRRKTQSLYPSIILHGVFNGAALIAAVSI
jgi:membrane protease YdiL (CAAX protease family)